MKIDEVKEMFKNEYYAMEVYKDKWGHKSGFHTDRIEELENWSEDAEVLEYELMDEEAYNNSILANCGVSFTDMYEADDKILVIKL
jgi:hypothetical protein